MSFIKDAWEGLTGQSAADAAIKASGISAAGQREGLDYLKQSEALPMQYRDQALGQMSEYYMPGGQPQSIDQMIQSIMGGEQFGAMSGIGADAIARNASATGGLRSGNTSEALASNDQQLMMQLLQQRMGGVQNLAGMPSSAPQISGMYGDIGRTQAAGITGAANAQQQGMGNLMNLGLGIGGLLV